VRSAVVLHRRPAQLAGDVGQAPVVAPADLVDALAGASEGSPVDERSFGKRPDDDLRLPFTGGEKATRCTSPRISFVSGDRRLESRLDG
jgi:hypothetical protein